MRDHIFIVSGEDTPSGVDSYDIEEIAKHTIPGCDFTDDINSEEERDQLIEDCLEEAANKGFIHRTGGKQSFVFTEDGAKKYFGNRFELLKAEVDKLTNDEFITDADRITFRIGQLLENKFDKYVYIVPYNELMTLDSFIREYASNTKHANRENLFRLENIVLYHY